MRVVTLRPPPIAASCWALVMHMRGVAHPLPEEWYADDADEPTALVHREPLPLAGRESEDGIRIQLGSWGEPERAVRVAAEAVDSAASMAQGRVMFAALDRALLPPLTSALAELPLPRVPTWQSKCGLYRPSATAAAARELELPSGVALRPLRGSDARLVDSRWTYRSARSAAMVRRSLTAARGLGCIGIADEGGAGELRGWIVRYSDGPLGMLWVEEAYRRRGYAAALIAAAERDLRAAGEPLFCYIVDENDASIRQFSRAGWERVADADWVGFAPPE